MTPDLPHASSNPTGLIIIIASIDGMRRDETDTIARYCRTYLYNLPFSFSIPLSPSSPLAACSTNINRSGNLFRRQRRASSLLARLLLLRSLSDTASEQRARQVTPGKSRISDLSN